MRIKILSLFLLLSICLMPIACDKTDTDSETTPPETTAEQFVPRLILSENGASEYKIINGKNIKADSLELLLDFVSDLRSMSSVTFARASDWGNSGPAETPEIIFGGANREECKEVRKKDSYSRLYLRYVEACGRCVLYSMHKGRAGRREYVAVLYERRYKRRNGRTLLHK